MSEIVWHPSTEQIEQANMTRFMKAVGIDDYQQLYEWSIEHSDQFWPKIIEFTEIIVQQPWSHVLLDADKMPGAKWFSGCELNFAENLLRYQQDKPALVFHNENCERVELSYLELKQQVTMLASSLRKSGVQKGDRVAGFLPNRPETIITMLATTSIGAVWCSCSMDFGFHGVFDRFNQIEPKILFVADGHFYNGKTHSAKDTVKQLQTRLNSVEEVIVVDNTHQDMDLKNTVKYDDFLDKHASELIFTPVAFDDPLYIMFSSGTTGVPKCIVHGVGGTLIQHAKELILHTNLSDTETIFYFTTCGWMMWNWLVSSLMTGATVVLYDGAPLYPDANRLFELIDQERISVFGVSAKYLSAVEKQQSVPNQSNTLQSLKTILSTGSPLVERNYDFVYRDIKQDVRLSSISGGTDIISCFALGNPILPVFKGELQCRGLGMNVEIFNCDGQSVRSEKGELVCTSPFPSMPIYFFNDNDGAKYHKAYFEKFPNVWAHGDFAELTHHDGLIIYGRSDTVLNPGGVRIGTAEIYREVEKMPEVIEAIAVGQPMDDDVRVVLFVVLKTDVNLSDDLKKSIQSNIKHHVSPHHVPKVILQVPEIPRTVSGKIVELAVRNVVMGEQVPNIDAIVNPETLKYFSIPEGI